MKSRTLENRALSIRVACVAILFLVGCTISSADETTAPPTASPTLERIPVTSCTELGCEDSLYIVLEGDIPSEYVIQIDDLRERSIVVHCFDRSTENSVTFTNEEYSLDDPAVEPIRQESPVVDLCGPGARGFVWKAIRKQDNATHQIVTTCAKDYAPVPVNVSCPVFPDDNRVHFRAFGRTIMDVTLYHDGKQVSPDSDPSYTSFRPNGPDCLPLCWTGVLTITLP